MRKYSLRAKLSAAFMFIAFFLFVVISIFTNFILKRQFEDYTVSKLDRTIQDTVSLITGRFDDWMNTWNLTGIENAGMDALGDGLILRIKDRSGNVVWDARIHNNGMCTRILEQMAGNMQSYDKNFKGGYEEKTYPIVLSGQTAGSVDIGYYGPYFYSDTDIQFLDTLNSFLVYAAAASLMVCIAFGTYMAGRLTKPITGVIQTAGKMARGDLGSRITVRSSTREIGELTDSINRLAQALGRQELLRKRLTADVAHELRTPLATLQSHIEAMIDGVWKPGRNRLISCREEILRLTKLVGELETLSRYEGENLTLHIERLDISRLLGNILTNFEGSLKRKGINLVFDAGEHWADADKDKISQVFINLISNAQKFTPEGGKIEIRVSETEGVVAVSVGDTGSGIPKEDMPHIFERFYRADRSRSRDTGGFGIGLAIAKSIVEAHGGTITAESEEGKGSVFTVSLPKQK